MENLCFWSHERKSEHLYIVTEGYSMVHRFTIGVVVGDEKVLVIDAGLGVAPGLRDYIERIVGTGKPLICACTHGHPDHVGSALLFDEAYLNSRDYPRLSSFALNTGQRLEDLKALPWIHQRFLLTARNIILITAIPDSRTWNKVRYLTWAV